MQLNNNKLILIVLSILCVFMIGITSIKSNLVTPIRMGVGYVLKPIQEGINVAGKALYNDIEKKKRLNFAFEENKRLNKQIDELISENTRLEEENLELERLRKLYELDNEYLEYETVAARIIAKASDKWFKDFRIDKGSKDGIKVDMNVIADGGLIGIVTDVGDNYATVRSIIDDISRVSAMSMVDNFTCIVSGDLHLYENGRLKLQDINEKADIKDGDKIVTSNISKKFLPGILIGYALNVKEDNSRLTKSGYLIPVANFDNLQEVLIIKQLKNAEQTN